LRWRSKAIVPLIANIQVAAEDRHDTRDQIDQRRPKAPNGSMSLEVWSVLLTLRTLSLTMTEAVANLSKRAEGPSVAEGMCGRV
jgi:hypothetical protein